MSITNKIIIASSRDSKSLVNEIKTQLRNEPVEITEDWQHPIKLWDAMVIFFVISEDSIRNPDLIYFVQQSLQKGLPLIGVVNDVSDPILFNLPTELEQLRTRNVIGLNNVDHEPTALESARGYLGLESFAKDQKVFISYRRLDSRSQANSIYSFLWENKFQAFLDTHQIEGGAVVQERILQEIMDKDLVLLLDSPNINDSPWVSEEILTAFTHRIPICVVKLQDDISFQLVKDMPQILWDASDSLNLQKVKLLISRCIASRESLDRRVLRTLKEISLLKGIEKQGIEKRSYMLSRNKLKLLFEYENSRISLERLHRLYKRLKDLPRCKKAVFVTGDISIPSITAEAITWARGRNSLEVVSLAELYETLEYIFPL